MRRGGRARAEPVAARPGSRNTYCRLESKGTCDHFPEDSASVCRQRPRVTDWRPPSRVRPARQCRDATAARAPTSARYRLESFRHENKANPAASGIRTTRCPPTGHVDASQRVLRNHLPLNALNITPPPPSQPTRNSDSLRRSIGGDSVPRAPGVRGARGEGRGVGLVGRSGRTPGSLGTRCGVRGALVRSCTDEQRQHPRRSGARVAYSLHRSIGTDFHSAHTSAPRRWCAPTPCSLACAGGAAACALSGWPSATPVPTLDVIPLRRLRGVMTPLCHAC